MEMEIEKSWIAESEARYEAYKRGELEAYEWDVIRRKYESEMFVCGGFMTTEHEKEEKILDEGLLKAMEEIKDEETVDYEDVRELVKKL